MYERICMDSLVPTTSLWLWWHRRGMSTLEPRRSSLNLSTVEQHTQTHTHTVIKITFLISTIQYLIVSISIKKKKLWQAYDTFNLWDIHNKHFLSQLCQSSLKPIQPVSIKAEYSTNVSNKCFNWNSKASTPTIRTTCVSCPRQPQLSFRKRFMNIMESTTFLLMLRIEKDPWQRIIYLKINPLEVPVKKSVGFILWWQCP